MGVRSDEIEVGDQLVERSSGTAVVVTDLWFDPVRGQKRPAGGMMAAVQVIGPDGVPRAYKRAYTRGQLAADFDRADRDIMAARRAAAASARDAGIASSVAELLERIRRDVMLRRPGA